MRRLGRILGSLTARSILVPVSIAAVFGLMGVFVGGFVANQTLGIIGNGAAVLAALAAMVTAVGTFLTVRQMQRQMEASYRPELTFARTFVRGEAVSPESPLPTRWTDRPYGWIEVTTTVRLGSDPERFCTNLYNIGLGAATSVNIAWRFPIEETVEEINRLAQRTLTPAYYEYKDDALFLKSETWPKKAIVWINEKSDSLDYILPESVQRSGAVLQISGTALKIPFAYIELISAYLYLWCQHNRSMREMKLPPLEIDISYRDISGRRHQASFILKIHVSAVNTPTTSSTMTFDAYLDAQRLV